MKLLIDKTSHSAKHHNNDDRAGNEGDSGGDGGPGNGDGCACSVAQLGRLE